jgi:hypothetical protein
MFNKFVPENHAVYEIMSKNLLQPGKPQMTKQYGACALRADPQILGATLWNLVAMMTWHPEFVTH